MAPDPEATAPAGSEQVVGGRYVWQEQLGRGGYGVVWRAHDTLLRRDVAVKAMELPPFLSSSERAAIRKKVLREARAAARLNHPGLVTIFDVIEEDGRALIVMEMVKAPTLAQLVSREGPLPDDRVATIGLGILDALAVAHAQGIIHRDVKPANVMVSASDRVQLTDFGIASVLDDPKVTTSSALAGSPSYMAPEQARNDPPSAASDLWGLGATLYFALEGEPPFRRDGIIATLTAVVNEPPRPRQRDTKLGAVIDDLLAKDPGNRPATGDVRRQLTEALAAAQIPENPTATVELGPQPQWDGRPIASGPPVTAAEQAGGPGPPPRAEPEPGPEPRAEPEPMPTRASSAEQEATSPTPVPPPSRRGTSVGSWGGDSRPRRSRTAAVATLGAAVVAVIVIVAVLVGSRGGHSPATSKPPSTTASASTPVRGSAPSTGTLTNAAPPKGWVSYRDPATGFSIAHPPNWAVSTSGTRTDFRDPVSSAYLRVDHREPPGPSPAAAWYQYEPAFAAQNPNYHRIQITPTTYHGFQAATWEYTYSAGGADVHAVDLGFITPGHGFALNFQTPAANWGAMQPTFDGFKAAFKAPSS